MSEKMQRQGCVPCPSELFAGGGDIQNLWNSWLPLPVRGSTRASGIGNDMKKEKV